MAKMIGDNWEFGYCRDRCCNVQSEPHITNVPHDRKLFDLSKAIQKALGLRCEIEYIITNEGEIHVVQAKDISNIDTLEDKESQRSIKLDGLRRIRKRRNYRERPVYVMNNKLFYINIITQIILQLLIFYGFVYVWNVFGAFAFLIIGEVIVFIIEIITQLDQAASI